MYDLAYMWMQENTLKDWKYVSLESSEPGCVQVSYKTTIHLHSVFQHFVPSQVLSFRILKKVCVRGPVLRETLVLRDIILIDTVQINMNMTVHRDTSSVLLVSATQIAVSWYLHFLEQTIRQQVADSLYTHYELLAGMFCSESTVNS
jgi:hypothetical protein